MLLKAQSHILALFLNPRFVYIVITINSCNLLHNAQQERTYILAKPDPCTHVWRCLHICSLPHEPAIHLFFFCYAGKSTLETRTEQHVIG